MAKSTDIGPIEQAAILCYRSYTNTSVDETGMQALFAMFGSPLSRQQIRHVITRSRQSDSFGDVRSSIVEKWQHRFDSASGLGETDAQLFLQELLTSFDRNLLFEYGVSASSTRIERGRVSDSWTYYDGTMPCWTVHLTTRGKALYLNDNIELNAGPGDVLLFRPEARFHCGLSPGARHWEHRWALFQPKPHWDDILEWQPLDTGIYHVAVAGNEPLAKMASVFGELVELNNEHTPLQADLQYNKLEELLIRAKGQSAAADDTIDKRIQKACDYMRGNIAGGFRLDEVATACNLSTSRFAHLFREQMGISPKCWSNNMRLQQARKLLLTDSDDINLIARQVGYDDPSQFSRYFKKSIGCSPREFRKAFSTRQDRQIAALSRVKPDSEQRSAAASH
ncbi:Arabinose operon regulatory protein [Halioglobus japonicus]|nr:Arabinose operon regulatory protein [Halioglobus japonicus]